MSTGTEGARPAPLSWPNILKLREDLLSGELLLAEFAADLHQVVLGEGAGVYRDPAEFFAVTYPTLAMRELAKDVGVRLAAKSGKAVRLLARTYGGGKTHTLTALYHLFHRPDELPDLPAVEEFRHHAGVPLERARIAALCFDKLDAEKGMEVAGPDGARRWLREPWSVLAYQLAGEEGLASLRQDGKPEERETPPAEPLLAKLLRGGPALILLDEVLMYARTVAGASEKRISALQDFFQGLTQAAAKAKSCAVVASLLATDPRKSDELGRRTLEALYAVFNREMEGEIQPVEKGDVAEVLRRRLFRPESLKDRSRFRAPAQAAVAAVSGLDEATAKDRAGAEERYLAGYPFHPDLIDVFYTKWTNIAGFQQTRGVLRSFAMALRGAAGWDRSPVAGVEIFLPAPGEAELGEGGRELARIAAQDIHEGQPANFKAIVEEELGKARRVQGGLKGVGNREIEQAVMAVFLHSQPAGQRAATRDLLALISAAGPDRIELIKGLRGWVEESWFLDEADSSSLDDEHRLPKAWRLGFRPNLKRMHDEEAGRVAPELVEGVLEGEIRRQAQLTRGAGEAGAVVNKLPARPADVADDGQFHYVLLGPEAASSAGRPSAEARQFLDETTGPAKPRSFRNAMMLAVPSADGLAAARQEIRSMLGWKEVKQKLAAEHGGLDGLREQLLSSHIAAAEKRIGPSVLHAYCAFVAISKDDKVEAHILKGDEGPLWERIAADARSRIVSEAIAMGTLLPGGLYGIWEDGAGSKPLKDLAEAFALNPKLPKLPGAGVIRRTLIEACERGEVVLRLPRADKSVRTFWRQRLDEAALGERALEVVLPGHAQLGELAPALVAPGALPGLWQGGRLEMPALREYFSGQHAVAMEHGEWMAVPAAARDVLEAAVEKAVRERVVWLVSGAVSLYGEAVPLGVLTDSAALLAPPAPVAATALLPAALPAGWRDAAGATSAAALGSALSRDGHNLPWLLLAEALEGALNARLLELAEGSAAWPAGAGSAGQVLVRVATHEAAAGAGAVMSAPALPGAMVAEAKLDASQVQDLADRVAELVALGAGHDLSIRLQVALGSGGNPRRETVEQINALLGAIHPDLRLR